MYGSSSTLYLAVRPARDINMPCVSPFPRLRCCRRLRLPSHHRQCRFTAVPMLEGTHIASLPPRMPKWMKIQTTTAPCGRNRSGALGRVARGIQQGGRQRSAHTPITDNCSPRAIARASQNPFSCARLGPESLPCPSPAMTRTPPCPCWQRTRPRLPRRPRC